MLTINLSVIVWHTKAKFKMRFKLHSGKIPDSKAGMLLLNNTKSW